MRYRNTIAPEQKDQNDKIKQSQDFHSQKITKIKEVLRIKNMQQNL